jgi:hypothetical protein
VSNVKEIFQDVIEELACPFYAHHAKIQISLLIFFGLIECESKPFSRKSKIVPIMSVEGGNFT